MTRTEAERRGYMLYRRGDGKRFTSNYRLWEIRHGDPTTGYHGYARTLKIALQLIAEREARGGQHG